MIELPFILAAGLLGSAHCVGMCGGFVMSIGLHSASRRHNLWRQLVYSSGRITTYAMLGALAGYFGMRLENWSWSMNQLVSIVALLAGAFLVVQGLVSLGWLKWPSWRRVPAVCLAASLFGSVQQGRRLGDAYFLGLLTGFLPCGLLYGMLALAANTRHFAGGATLMACFGAGTIPALLLTGLGAQWMSGRWRQRLYQLAGVCLVVTGLITIGRGVDIQHLALRTPGNSCPFCAAESE
ncbi:MAG: sulfite exporter TauE/SafE family protein [Pirellulales bacterium]